ncbi:MAG: TIGR03905 family TSCPD domain-containing protein [Bacteroides sp.]|nr:TIGR03905 family TSCPD domain-containing protein [Bacteroides sp.]
MELTYKPQGTCSQVIEVSVDDNHIIEKVVFWGGCNGNLQGISRLVTGLSPQEVLARLEGVRCGNRSTSCPDQLCKALRQMGY